MRPKAKKDPSELKIALYITYTFERCFFKYLRPDLALELLHQLSHPVHVLPVLVGSELHLLDAPVSLQARLVRLGTSQLRRA